MKVKVTKVTEQELAKLACESTFLGTAKADLSKLYRSEHSPSRTQLFWVECDNIPQFVVGHLVRHHVGSVPFALTHRDDREGGEDLGRHTPSKVSLMINAQSLIDMAKQRLCLQAHKETVQLFNAIKKEVTKCDPDLAEYLVPKCVYRNGLCGEFRPCGFLQSSKYIYMQERYNANFSKKGIAD